MKKTLLILLLISLFTFTGCSREITITFMVNDQVAYSVKGSKPITLNPEDFNIDDEMIVLNNWLDKDGNVVDFSKPFKKNTTLYGDVTMYYYVNWVSDGKIIQTDVVEQNSNVVAPERIPTIDGYIFTGWLDDEGKTPESIVMCNNDLTFVAQYEETIEKIIVVNDVIEFDSPDSSWKRAGVTHNMGYPLTFSPSNPEVATYYDTHIFPHSSGTCVFTITSESGIVKYLTVIVH